MPSIEVKKGKQATTNQLSRLNNQHLANHFDSTRWAIHSWMGDSQTNSTSNTEPKVLLGNVQHTHDVNRA